MEETTNQVKGGKYVPLDTPTPEQKALISQYSSSGSIPFVDFGNQYMISGATFDPGVLAGRTQQQVANSLNDPLSDTTESLLGASNAITAAICKMTNNQPADVCTSKGVMAAAATLHS